VLGDLDRHGREVLKTKPTKPIDQIANEIYLIVDHMRDSRIVHGDLSRYVHELLAQQLTLIDVYEGMDGEFYPTQADALMAMPDQAQRNPKLRKALVIEPGRKIWLLVDGGPVKLYRDATARARADALAKLSPADRRVLGLEDP